MLAYLTKNYWWMTLILIGIGIFLDLKYNEVETIRKPFTVIAEDGSQQSTYILTLKNSYQIIRALVGIFYTLGVSLLILVAIDKRIDTEENKRYQHELKTLDEKIHNNIFDGVLNKIVPELLFDQVKKDIFKTDIIRKNAKWNYLISEKNNSFELHQTIQYEIENLTDGRIEKEIPVQLFFSNQLVDTKLTHWKIKKINGDIEREEKVNFTKLILCLDSRETKKIELNVSNEYHNETVLDTHITSYSIIGLELQIQKPANIDFKVMPTFTSNLNENRPNNQLITFDKIPCILLGQGIVFIIEKNNVP